MDLHPYDTVRHDTSYLFKNTQKNQIPKQLYSFFITIFKNIYIQKLIRIKKFFWGKRTCSPFLK
jgi:hypothetical protein